MTTAIRIRRFGGPEVLEFEQVPVEDPAPGNVVVAHTAIGLNMVDTYYRSGLYPLELPSGLGAEAAGTVAAVGAGIQDLAPGDRVAYVSPPPLDAYAHMRTIARQWLVKLPDSIDDETAAAAMLKGLTSWYLLRRSYRVKAGDWVLVYAAAGGVGLILTQWACALDARVIGVVGSAEKAPLAHAAGCESVLVGTDAVASRVREITGGKGVPVVYDSIGRVTFMESLDCLSTHGTMVSFGNASGPVDPVSPLELLKRGSLYLTRPNLFDFVRDPAELRRGTEDLFGLIRTGTVSINVQQRFQLADVAAAHAALEGRRTTGSTILLP